MTVAESENHELQHLADREYEYGFVTDIEVRVAIPPGIERRRRTVHLVQKGRAPVDDSSGASRRWRATSRCSP